jgi:hypothetical protein
LERYQSNHIYQEMKVRWLFFMARLRANSWYGNLQNSNVYAAISDVKLKENIVDASPKLAD